MLAGQGLIVLTALIAVLCVGADALLTRRRPSRLAVACTFAVVLAAGAAVYERHDLLAERGRDAARIAALEHRAAAAAAPDPAASADHAVADCASAVEAAQLARSLEEPPPEDDAPSGYARRRRSEEPAAIRRISFGGRIWKVPPVERSLLRDGETTLLALESGPRGLLVSAILRDAGGRVIGRLERNDWLHNAHGGFDRNFTPDVVEVVDHNERVLFQVVRSGGVVSVEGAFQCGNGSTVQLMHGPTREQAVFALSPAHLPPMLSIPPLCAYPSDLRQGDCPGVGGHKRLLDWYRPTGLPGVEDAPIHRWSGALDLCGERPEVAMGYR